MDSRLCFHFIHSVESTYVLMYERARVRVCVGRLKETRSARLLTHLKMALSHMVNDDAFGTVKSKKE